MYPTDPHRPNGRAIPGDRSGRPETTPDAKPALTPGHAALAKNPWSQFMVNLMAITLAITGCTLVLAVALGAAWRAFRWISGV